MVVLITASSDWTRPIGTSTSDNQGYIIHYENGLCDHHIVDFTQSDHDGHYIYTIDLEREELRCTEP